MVVQELLESLMFLSLNLKFFLKFIYLGETERQHVSGRGRERRTESEAGSRLRAVSTEPDAGLEPTNREIMT